MAAAAAVAVAVVVARPRRRRSDTLSSRPHAIDSRFVCLPYPTDARAAFPPLYVCTSLHVPAVKGAFDALTRRHGLKPSIHGLQGYVIKPLIVESTHENIM